MQRWSATPAGVEHVRTSHRIAAEFRRALKDGPCVPFNSDLRLKIEATGLLTYPDLSVICGPPSFVDENEDTVTNPTLLAEVYAKVLFPSGSRRHR